MNFPPAPRGSAADTFQSAVQGRVNIPNPYKWLEDASNMEYIDYVKVQNSRTEAYIHNPASASFLQSLSDLLTKLHMLPSLASPLYSCGDHYYYRVSGQGKLFPVWYRIAVEKLFSDDPTTAHEVFHDELTEKGAVVSSGFSLGGKYWAYSSSIQGSEWSPIHIRATSTGEKLNDEIVDTKFTGKSAPISWLADIGFFYLYWPNRGTGMAPGLGPQLRFHRVGDSQDMDEVVYEEKASPTHTFCARTNGEWVFLFVLGSGRTSQVKAARVPKKLLNEDRMELDLKFDIVISDDFDTEWEYAGSTLIAHYFRTTRNNGEIVALDKSSLELVTTIPGNSEKTLKLALVLSNGNIAVVHSINVHDEISIYSARGEFLSSISTSVLTVLAIEPLFTSGATNDLFILESVFYSPPTLHITTASNTTRELPLFGSKAGPSDFTTRQVFYPSLDKVEIPMFITHQTSKPITSKTPVLLYVYGGFGISLIPHFRPDFLAFMTSFRGVLACANIRGGGEKGHAWYTAAQKSNRQVLFNDIIYAVQYIKTNLGTDNVILMGESMGGLNVCSTMVQQPNLFKGVIANVGVLDVLRRKRLGLRDRGAADIGDVDIPEEFDDLLKWAPLENVKRGVRYPPVMLTTGAQDDLVPALHSVKMAATLQWAAEGVAGEEERGDVSLIVASEGSGHGFNNSAQVKTEASVARWGWVKRAVGLETIFDG